MTYNFYPELSRSTIVYSTMRYQRFAGEYLRICVEVEELAKPVMRGTSLRTHRVWQNGRLAGGGAWRHSEEDAIEQANYLVESDYAAKLSTLEQRVCKLEVILSQLKAENEALKEQRHYTEVSQ